MTIMQLKCFYEAAKFKSITKAANELYISQPSVSKYILQLEKELDLRLLARTNKTLSLTEEGKPIFEHCRAIFEHVDGIYKDAEKMRQILKNENVIRISCVPTIRLYGVITLVNDFMRKYPEIDIVLEEKDEDKVIYDLQASACDISFCSDLTFIKNEFPRVVVCSENFSALLGKRNYQCEEDFSIETLKKIPLILNRPESMLLEHCRNACRAYGFEPTIKLVSSHPEVAADFVLDTNACYVGLTSAINNQLTDEHLAFEMPEISSFDYCFFWNDESKNEASNLFIDFVRNRLKIK